ncbi:sugar phosphate nucleotidyltransferase [Candidatus Nitrosotenuis chungbukensis]|uniref:sugar phosphate nucleotidyltransferase n=1 Tax=Candidatus Nitrosotenuis chungbukensis TaxID=1353246 RepID=UPI0005B2D398|nr:sugar phosphate nucleotidyltransferase [Candidatus Nitrosotenuis chungbukensis]
MVDTAVIPVAGLGTRLLTLTKDNPKEMVPVFTKSFNELVLRPLIEHIFLHLFDSGIKNFFFIVGKKKRSIEDHFTPERNYQEYLKKKDLNYRDLLEDFYKKIEKSNIVWINQNSPRGFGAAILNAKEIVGSKPFLVHAGDAYVRGNSKHILKLIKAYERNQSDIIFYLKAIQNPRAYGVAEVSKINREVFQVHRVEEKPKRPKSNLAIMPIYVFNSKIFDALLKIKPGFGNELQLTDAIQKIIDLGGNVRAMKFNKMDDCIDIGTPENYYHALSISYADSKKNRQTI